MNDKNKKVKTLNRQKLIKRVLLTLAVLIIIFGGFKLYGHYRNKPASSTVDQTNAQIKSAADVDAQNKKTYIENNNNKADDSSHPTTPNPSSEISLSAKQEANGSVTVTTKLPSVSSGTCTLSEINGTKTSSQSAPIIYQPEFSTCAGFSIPQSTLGSGIWKIDLKLSGSSTASASTTIEVK